MLLPQPTRSRFGTAPVLMSGIGAIALFVGLADSACSLFVSTDGLTTNAAADPALDASNDAVVDASNDVAIGDSSDERSNDDDADTDAGFCDMNTSALFCDDFDNGPLGAKWDHQLVTGGTLALDSTMFRSSPFSAAITADGNPSQVYLMKGISASAGNYRVAFAIRIATPPTGSALTQILATFGNGNGAQLELTEDPGGCTINDRINGTYGTEYVSVPGISTGTWHDVVIHLKFAGDGGTTSASIDVDGSNVAPSFNIASAFNEPTAVVLKLGVVFITGASTAIKFDSAAIFSE